MPTEPHSSLYGDSILSTCVWYVCEYSLTQVLLHVPIFCKPRAKDLERFCYVEFEEKAVVEADAVLTSGEAFIRSFMFQLVLVAFFWLEMITIGPRICPERFKTYSVVL